MGGFSRNPRDSGPCISRTQRQTNKTLSVVEFAICIRSLGKGEAPADEFSLENESPSIDEMKKAASM
jgi:hypothetical protein